MRSVLFETPLNEVFLNFIKFLAMTDISDKMIEIPRTDLPKLRDIFLTNWPRHIIGYELVNNFIRWYNQDPNFDEAIFYSLNGDWSDGTFIVIVSISFLISVHVVLPFYVT